MTSPRLVLRDGSAASVRPAMPADVAALRRFFERLSAVSRYQRFLTAGEPPDAVIARLSDSTDPSRALTFVVERAGGPAGPGLRIIATASYIAITDDTAEVAFAVADDFQGKGLGTALLERLAVAASSHGFHRFQATTLEHNTGMLEVFRDSGFEIRSKSAEGCIDVQLSLEASAAGVAAEEERNRLATAASIYPLLAPRAVAVIGASRNPSNIGRRVLDAIAATGFTGPIYAVNPHATEVGGIQTYSSARELPNVDLAVIAVPAAAVSGVVDDCAAAGIRSIVVISAGFAETGSDGRALQHALTDKVRGYGMRMVGPNCMGVLNTDPAVRLNASFSPVFPPNGHIGFLSQSGALGIAIIELASQRGLGLSTFVSVGNKADVSGNDLLEYWEGDAATRVVLLYLESFGNPRRFARLARRIGRKKPIIVVKSGRTRAGSRAASSHTAALAASDVAVDALFHQSGVIRADTLDEMFDVAACLDTQPLPPGRRVAIVTNAGGPGILAADACDAAGLTLADLSSGTRARLAAHLPAAAGIGNPIDMVASSGEREYRQTIETVLSAAEVDALIVIFTPVDAGSSAAILRAICDGVTAARRGGGADKPVLACLLAERGRLVPLEAGGERLPAYAFPENAVRALGRSAAYAEWRRRAPALLWGFDDLHVDEARAICRAAIARRGEGWLNNDEVQAVLAAFGMPLAAGRVAHTSATAAAVAAEIGFPVAVKLSSTDIQHKTDIGAVRLDVPNAAAVRDAFDAILLSVRQVAPDAKVDGVVVQPMIGGGVETMMGIVQDPVFGPLIAFGLGGIHVEILKDVLVRVAPLTDRDADELLHGIKGFRLLQGYRGHPAADLDALRDLLLRLSRLADSVPEIAELDLNPVIALSPGQGCRIADARIMVRQTIR